MSIFKKCILAVLVLSVVVCFGTTAQAKGLLGERYVSLEFSITRPGNSAVKDIDSSIFGMNGGFNLPINTNTDFTVGLSYAKLDGSLAGVDIDATSKGISAGLIYHFAPEEQLDPFIGGSVGYVETEAELHGYLSEDEKDAAGSISAGVEFDLTEKAAITPSLRYVKIGSNDDTGFSLALNVWLSDTVVLAVGAGYWFDEGDTAYGGGMAISF